MLSSSSIDALKLVPIFEKKILNWFAISLWSVMDLLFIINSLGNLPVVQRFFKVSSIVFQVFFKLFLYAVNVLK